MPQNPRQAKESCVSVDLRHRTWSKCEENPTLAKVVKACGRRRGEIKQVRVERENTQTRTRTPLRSIIREEFPVVIKEKRRKRERNFITVARAKEHFLRLH